MRREEQAVSAAGQQHGRDRVEHHGGGAGREGLVLDVRLAAGEGEAVGAERHLRVRARARTYVYARTHARTCMRACVRACVRACMHDMTP